MDNHPRPGNRGFDDAGRAEAAREAARWRAATERSEARPLANDDIRRILGPEARVVSSVGRTPLDSWGRLAARGFAAQRAMGGLDPSSSYRFVDPDDVENENRRLGQATSVAKYNR